MDESPVFPSWHTDAAKQRHHDLRLVWNGQVPLIPEASQINTS